MRNAATAKKTVKPVKHHWARFDAMTPAQRKSSAASDPDAQPITAKNQGRLKRAPQVKVVRRALELSQEEFADRFRIPLGILRDWEQGRNDPDPAAKAYLSVIARDPAAVTAALRS